MGVTVRNLGSTVPVSPYVQDLRNANIHAFCFLPLSQHALVLFEFPRQVSRCPGGRFTLFLPHISWELIVGRNGAQGGPCCQDTKTGSNKSDIPPFQTSMFRSCSVEIYFRRCLVIKGLMKPFLIVKGEITG